MRPSRDAWFMEQAGVVAKRSTCLRRAVGCILVDARGHQLSTGYNGRAAGLPHCNEARSVGGGCHGYPDEYPFACAGATAPSGTMLDACEAIHAEQNALLQCPDVYRIVRCYSTTAPCVTCTKLLLNTTCEAIVFRDDYPQADAAKKLWEAAGRGWARIPQ